MNDQKLAEQLKKSKNLMNLTFGLEWQKEAAEDDGWVEAGVAARPYYNYIESLTEEQHRFLRFQAQLLSILLPELKQWIRTWELGLSFEPVNSAAKQMLYQHLKRLVAKQADWVAALIDEDSQHLPIAERPIRSQAAAVLAQLFTPKDWHELAEVAARGMSQTVIDIQQSITQVDSSNGMTICESLH